MNIVVNVLIVPSVILTCSAFLAFMLARASAALRHEVWAIAVFGAAALPLALALVPKWEIPVITPSTAVMVIPSAQPARDVIPGSESIMTVRHETPLPSAPADSGGGAGMFWLVAVWVIGAIVVLVRFVLGVTAVWRLAGNASVLEAEAGRQLLDTLQSRLAIRRRVRVLVGLESFPPMTWGSMILLPAEASDWTLERQQFVIAHELAHVKRHDGLLQALVQLICAAYWFNPLVWLAAKRLRMERERECDDHVLNLGVDGHTYASHLVDVARVTRLRELSMATVSMANPSQLETRICAIMDSKKNRRPLSNLATRLGYCMAAGLIVVVATIRVTATPVLLPILSAPPEVIVPEPEAVASVIPIQTPTSTPTDKAIENANDGRLGYQFQIPLSGAHLDGSRFVPYAVNGSDTDRGRILIQYGRPDEMESHLGTDGSAYQIWTYRRLPGGELKFEFVDSSGKGEYRLVPTGNPPAVQQQQVKWAGTWKLNKDRSTVPRDSGFSTTFTSIDSFTLQLVLVPGGVSVRSEVSIIPPGEPAGSSRRAETRAKFTIMFGEITSVRSIMPFIDQNGTVMFQPTSDGFEITATSGTQTVRLIDVIRFVVSDDGRTLNETVNTVPGVVGVFEKQ